MPHEANTPPRWFRRPRVIRDLAFAFVVAVITLLVNHYGGEVLSPAQPRSIAEQLRTIEEQGGRRHLAVQARETSLDGTGKPSIVVLMSHVFGGISPYKPPPSDEIYIYDVEGLGSNRRLSLQFAFRPRPTPNVPPFTDAWRFELQGIADFFHDGRHELVGGFTENRADTADQRPVMLVWNPGTARYVLIPLLPRPVPLRHLPSTDRAVLENNTLYRAPARIADDHLVLKDFGTPLYYLVPGRGHVLLLTAVRTGSTRTNGGLNMHGYVTDVNHAPGFMEECGEGIVPIDGFAVVRPTDLPRMWARVPKYTIQNRCA